VTANKNLTLRVDATLLKQAKKIAKDNRITVSAVVRMAMKNGLPIVAANLQPRVLDLAR
jgi:antitoxin component of RelBE/YafQ-DinJ toxin-antitoxin module